MRRGAFPVALDGLIDLLRLAGIGAIRESPLSATRVYKKAQGREGKSTFLLAFYRLFSAFVAEALGSNRNRDNPPAFAFDDVERAGLLVSHHCAREAQAVREQSRSIGRLFEPE
jgi:hypothetical protein